MGVHAVITMVSNLIFVFVFSSALIASASSWSCNDFAEGACDLSEDNIVGHDRFTDTAAECQEKCRGVATCFWFTHYDTQCYLLSHCGQTEHCKGCASGPTTPDIDTCPWPPVPGTSTISPPTTTTATTKTTTSSTTTTRTTTTPTPTPTTTTTTTTP